MDVSPYIKYLISNFISVNDWIEKFGIGDDDEIIKNAEKMASLLNDIIDRMKDLGIETSEIRNESYDITENIRDFKIKRIINNEGN